MARLPTLGALAPPSSPLLQLRFIKKATAPAHAASRIAPSSHPIRLRNRVVNSRGEPTGEFRKQQALQEEDFDRPERGNEETSEEGHGRIEHRSYFLSTDLSSLSGTVILYAVALGAAPCGLFGATA